MIKTAEQIGIPEGTRKRRPYPANRRSRLAPAPACKNAYRGCTNDTGGRQAGLGWCGNCYHRNRKWGDSWYHSPNVSQCRHKCFMGHNREENSGESGAQGPGDGKS